MPQKKVNDSGGSEMPIRGLTPGARESQLVSLAYDIAEQQLRDGTATSQVITHFLKLGTLEKQLEIEKLRNENKLLEVKAENIKAQERSEELMINAMNAFRLYSGRGDDEEDEDV